MKEVIIKIVFSVILIVIFTIILTVVQRNSNFENAVLFGISVVIANVIIKD